MSGHRAHRGAVLGVAAGGVLLGHWLTYRLASPQAPARDALLAHTGHGYLGLANDLGLALLVVAVAAIVLGQLIRGDAPPAGAGRWFARLAGFQIAAFASMEVLERISSGARLGELMHHGLLPTGVAVQVAIAAVGALTIRWLLRAATHLREVLAHPALLPRRSTAAHLVVASLIPVARPVPATVGIRGPPPR